MIGIDAAGLDDRRHQAWVAGLTDEQRHPGGERLAEAGRQVVQHHHLLAGIDERVHHVTADIAGAAGHQDGHWVHTLSHCADLWTRRVNTALPAPDHRVASGGRGHHPKSPRRPGSRMRTSAACFLHLRQRALIRISPSVASAP